MNLLFGLWSPMLGSALVCLVFDFELLRSWRICIEFMVFAVALFLALVNWCWVCDFIWRIRTDICFSCSWLEVPKLVFLLKVLKDWYCDLLSTLSMLNYENFGVCLVWMSTVAGESGCVSCKALWLLAVKLISLFSLFGRFLISGVYPLDPSIFTFTIWLLEDFVSGANARLLFDRLIYILLILPLIFCLNNC